MAVKKKTGKTEKKAAAKRAKARKPASKKAPARRPAAGKAAVKKAAVKKPASKKAPARKPAARKAAVKKAAVKKPASKKAPARKPASKKAPERKGPAKKPARRQAAPAIVVRVIDEDLNAQKEAAARKKKRLPKDALNVFQGILKEKRLAIIDKARSTIDEGMKLDEAELPDEYDQATSEYLQYFTLRLRGREKYFLDKIDQALARIDDGSFGYCESCGDEIGLNRLKARPETTLCIRCKEAQEREERQFGD